MLYPPTVVVIIIVATGVAVRPLPRMAGVCGSDHGIEGGEQTAGGPWVTNEIVGHVQHRPSGGDHLLRRALERLDPPGGGILGPARHRLDPAVRRVWALRSAKTTRRRPPRRDALVTARRRRESGSINERR